MTTMRAVRITEPGGPEVLEMGEVDRPEPGPDQVRVRVRAAGVNRAELLQRRGLYPAPPGWPVDVPGLEYAGEVEAIGERVRKWRPGERVMGLVGGGGYAEYVVVHEREAIGVPDGLSWEAAAAVPEVFVTAHDALFTRGRLAMGQTLLVHAVGSGVGTAALQLAKAAGATVLGTLPDGLEARPRGRARAGRPDRRRGRRLRRRRSGPVTDETFRWKGPPTPIAGWRQTRTSGRSF